MTSLILTRPSEASHKAMDHDPVFPPRESATGPGESIRLILQHLVSGRIQARYSAVVLPLAGGESVQIDLDPPSGLTPWIATCADVERDAAYIAKRDDLVALLDAYPGVQWHDDDDGAYLIAFHSNAETFTALVLRMWDAAKDIAAYARGLKANTFDADPADTESDRDLQLTLIDAEIVRLQRTAAAIRAGGLP